LLVAAVVHGAYDPPEWRTVTSNYNGRRAQLEVSSDALTVLGVRINVTARGAQRIADALGTVVPTPRILQLIWEQAEVRLEPCNANPDAEMASTQRMIEHSECVDQRVAGRRGMVANEGKHWVLSNRLAGKENLAANYGWFVKGSRPIQGVGTHHDTGHTDYSQIVRLVKPALRVEGREIDLREVGRSPELWGLVSDEGPLLVLRTSKPGEPPSSRQEPVASAPPPAPKDPKAVRAALESKGLPIRPEQLPPTTRALRRSTFQRSLLSSLRLRPEDIPDVAYASAGAAACGGRDLFFELMNEVSVNVAELEQTKDSIRRALACGQALTPSMRAGAASYELEYDHGSAPSGFAPLAHAEPRPLPPATAELAALFLEPSQAEEVAVAKGGSCGFALDFTAVELCPDETARERALDTINDSAILCGTRLSGSILNASRQMVFLARDEAAADAIQSALQQRAIEVRYEAGVAQPNRPEQEVFTQALRAAAARSARSAKIERRGRLLSVTATLAPSPAELRDMARLLDARAARAKRVAEVVQGLAEGKLPTAQALEGLGEPPLPATSAAP